MISLNNLNRNLYCNIGFRSTNRAVRDREIFILPWSRNKIISSTFCPPTGAVYRKNAIMFQFPLYTYRTLINQDFRNSLEWKKFSCCIVNQTIKALLSYSTGEKWKTLTRKIFYMNFRHRKSTKD